MKLKTKQNWLLTIVASTLFFSLHTEAQVNIGNQDPPKPFSLLELNTNNSGLRLTQLTTYQRDSVSDKWKNQSVADKLEGLVIYNLNTNCIEFWNGNKWINTCSEPLGRSKKPIIQWLFSDLLYRSTGSWDGDKYSGFCTESSVNFVYGSGVPGSKITITWCDGTTDEGTVGSDAIYPNLWRIYTDRIKTSSPSCWLKGTRVEIVQTEPGKAPSEPVILYIGDSLSCATYV